MDRSSRSYREKIMELVEPVLESEKVELVDVECLKGQSRWMIRIYIDKEGGVGLDDCALISGEVGDLLDIHETPPGSYTLEISSPGLDRPLARDKDFIRYTGHAVKISVSEKIDNRRNFKGTLVDYVEKKGEKVLIVDVGGTKYTIPRDVVVKANLQYEF